MDYSVGSLVRVRLYSGGIVRAEITATVNKSAGRRIQIHFEGGVAATNPT
jgi:hypothetical protein